VVVVNGAGLSKDVRTKTGLKTDEANKTDPTVRLVGVQTKAGGETVEIAIGHLLVEVLPIGTVVDRLQASGAGAAALTSAETPASYRLKFSLNMVANLSAVAS
jgi:hypothetical protein